MPVTRRSLAKLLAGAAVIPRTEAQPAANEDLEAARKQMRANLDRIAKVKLPMATEPAFRFKA